MGLAAWIYAMFQDIGGSDSTATPRSSFTLDEMLDDIMLYWLPNTGASSARIYWEMTQVNGPRPAPRSTDHGAAGFSIMPGEYVGRPGAGSNAATPTSCHFNEVARGGHFAALEQPELLVDDIRTTFRHL